MKLYNYTSMIMLPMIDNIRDPKIIDKHLERVCFADYNDKFNYHDIDVKNNRCYVVLNADGSSNYIENIKEIKTLSTYIRSYDLDLGNKVLVFEIPDEYNDEYKLLIEGQYKSLSNELRVITAKYYNNWANVLDVIGRHPQARGKTIMLIAANSKILVDNFWATRSYNDERYDEKLKKTVKISDDAHNYLMNQIRESGNYWSAPTMKYQILNYK